MCPTHLKTHRDCPQNHVIYWVVLYRVSNVYKVSYTLTQLAHRTIKWIYHLQDPTPTPCLTHSPRTSARLPNEVISLAGSNLMLILCLTQPPTIIHKTIKWSVITHKVHNVSNTLTQIVHYEVQLTAVHHHLQRSFLDHVIHWNTKWMTVFSFCFMLLFQAIFLETEAERRKVPCFSYWKRRS